MTTRHALRRLGGTAALLLLGAAAILASAPGASAEPHPSRAFATCAGVNAEYPGGVARTQAAADRVVRQGHLRPIVCPTAYAENRARLDRDRDGVVCERRR